MPDRQTESSADAARLSEPAETDDGGRSDDPDEMGTRNGNTPTLSELVATVDDVAQPVAINRRQPGDGTCCICGGDGPLYQVTGTHGVFSGAFTSSYLFDAGDGVCWRCRYLSNAMDYRRYHWLATEDEIRIIKKRPELLDVLLDPPEGAWMAKYKDESDFLTVLNGWISGQRLNRSRDQYDLLVDKRRVSIDRAAFADMIEFGQRLRARDDEPSKRALKGPVLAADLARYDLERDEVERINNDLTGREDWRIAVQLIQ